MRIEILKHIFLFIALLSAPLLAPSAFARDFHNCDANEQIALNQNVDYMLSAVEKALADEANVYETLRAKFDRWNDQKGNHRPRFHQVLACIKEKIENDRFDFRCTEDPRTTLGGSCWGQVRNADILLSHFFGNGTVELAKEAIRYYYDHPRDGSLLALVAHEVSHLCDTQDKSYISTSLISGLSENVPEWWNNADTYKVLINPYWDKAGYFQ